MYEAFSSCSRRSMCCKEGLWIMTEEISGPKYISQLRVLGSLILS